MGLLGRRGLRRMFQTTSLLFIVVIYGLCVLEGGGLAELRLEGCLDAGDDGSSELLGSGEMADLVRPQLNWLLDSIIYNCKSLLKPK